MAEVKYAEWVEPIAARLRGSRAAIVAFARSTPAEAWQKPSPLDGWICRDILAHLAGGNDQMLQKVLRAVVAGEQVDSSILKTDTDAENRRGVLERRHRTVEELIAALEADGREIQDLLSRLGREHQELRQDGLPLSLGQFLGLVHAEDHDRLHLEQLREALGRS